MSGTHSAATTVAVARILNVALTEDTLSVDLEDGRTIAVPLGWFPRLALGSALNAPTYKSVARATPCIGPILTKTSGSKA